MADTTRVFVKDAFGKTISSTTTTSWPGPYGTISTGTPATVFSGDSLSITLTGTGSMVPVSIPFTITTSGTVTTASFKPATKHDFEYGDIVTTAEGDRWMVIGKSTDDEYDWEITPLEETRGGETGDVFGYNDDELEFVGR